MENTSPILPDMNTIYNDMKKKSRKAIGTGHFPSSPGREKI
jgi:hypothetical protein